MDKAKKQTRKKTSKADCACESGMKRISDYILEHSVYSTELKGKDIASNVIRFLNDYQSIRIKLRQLLRKVELTSSLPHKWSKECLTCEVLENCKDSYAKGNIPFCSHF